MEINVQTPKTKRKADDKTINASLDIALQYKENVKKYYLAIFCIT